MSSAPTISGQTTDVIAILGSGFGLYGYLPALVQGCGQRVVLSERHREPFHVRRELARFADDVQWEPDEASALDRADGVVLALPPRHQSDWIPRCLVRPNLARILVEKPLAPCPEAAGGLLEDLGRSGKVFRIGYTFRYMDWAQRIRATLKQGESRRLSIQWSFLAHHFRHDLRNWKRFTDSGGGAVRFYGIQLIALLAELGYEVVISSHTFGSSVEVIEKWTASFAAPGLPECEIAVDTRSVIEKFTASLLSSSKGPGLVLADLNDPFESVPTAESLEGLDRRVPALRHLCRSLWEQTTDENLWYKATIDLWRSVEERTSFERTGRDG
jgi:predicted dehydrogenase